MKTINILHIKGAVLDLNQLEKYLENIASDHLLQKYSDKNTYPIPRLEDNFKFITKTYDILNTNLKMKINIHPAGEWLLDNYYMIEESVTEIKKELTLKKYKEFLGIASGAYKGYSRIYVLASEIVAYTDGKIDVKNIGNLLKAYQNKKTLNMEEIWNINVFIKIALIENIRIICEKIYSAQMQKYRVESILESTIENKKASEKKYKIEYNSKILGYGQVKYPFIEYMSYRLKRYGKQGIKYLNALEEQVNKMGTTVADVIKKEHYDIALKKVSIGNSIRSIKELQSINFLEIFEEINGVEKVLKQDPAGIYEKMDYKTKEYYRNKIKELSEKTKISEIYIANKIFDLASNAQEEKKKHVGYYLIDNGIDNLNHALGVCRSGPCVRPIKNTKTNVYICLIILLPLIISTITGIMLYNKTNNIIISIIQVILVYIPIVEIVTSLVQYILGKTVKPKLIPKMDLSDGVPEEYKTMVVIPTIVKSSGKVKELFEKLEVYYLGNKSENIYFTLLGDCSESDKEQEKFDDEVIKTGLEEVNRLNKKYEKQGLGRFNFLYRKRYWNDGEAKFIGWERKRGLLHQFNEYLLGHEENVFKTNTLEQYTMQDRKNFKYIITLDADTDLVLNSGLELIGAMAHILNKPELNKEQTVVIDGHALIQPRVGIDLLSSKKSLFTEIFAGNGGTDSYTNAISDIYQDNFEEGIYTGKGIYDLQVFSKVLSDSIPENTVLSHDLLEGSYLRCGLASDIILMDGYPFKYNAFINRLHRWIRGDWQIVLWLKNKIKNEKGEIIKNPLNKLSKFKILDNLRRSLNEASVVLSIVFLSLLTLFYNINNSGILTILFISILMPTIIDLINKIIYKKSNVKYQKTYDNHLTDFKASMLRGLIGIMSLPHKAYISVDAIIKTIYRIKVSKKNLLEWTTAEEAERTGKTDLLSYYKFMWFNILLASFSFIYGVIFSNIVALVLSILWFGAPCVMWHISKEKVIKSKLEEISNKDKEYVLDIGKRTWNFFETYLTKENNYLIPDNYQEDRPNKIVNRTSSTNVGLSLLAVVSACDLGYIEKNKAIHLINCILETISKLPKWNGHLYNWYNIDTLEPLIPRYISTVDSGNFVGYLYVLKTFLEEMQNQEGLQIIVPLIENTDFSKLYDNEKRIFSIGYNIEDNKLTDSYYDLLASEARQASFVAIAKKDVSYKHWNSLSRTLTVMDKYKGLVSWSGTAFEYLMPNINMTKYPGSLLDESCRFMIMCQEKYGKKLGIPWGISEAAFNLKDLNYNYQYKAFGIPWLGLKRGLADELVVSSYGSILAINEVPNKVIKNLKILEEQGMYNKYGFYESIDYTPERVPQGKTYMPVKTYMAHHQGLILLSINNLIKNNILQKRFNKNPEIKALDILLQERMPENVVVTKERKEKVEKIKYSGYDNYTETVYTKMDNKLEHYNVISNENYSICINQKGEGFSKYKDILINRYKSTNDYEQGIDFYIKNVNTKQLWTSSYKIASNKYTTHFMPDKAKFIREDGDIRTVKQVTVAPNDNVEIRSITLKNMGNKEEILEVTSLFEPVLSKAEQDYAHMAYNNLFLKYERENENIIVKRNGKENNDLYLGVNLYTNGESIGELEYEIDKEKLYENGSRNIPKMIENSLPFTKQIGLVTDPVIALKRTVKVKPQDEVTLNLIITVDKEKEVVLQNLEDYKNSENIERTYELSKARVEEEARYLQISGKQIELYQKMLGYLIVQNPLKSLYINQVPKRLYKQSEFWKFGISGDLPIVAVKIKEINDLHVIKEILKAYEYYRVKNVELDLVLICDDDNVYEQYVKNEILSQIYASNLAYTQNIRGGIFILNNKEIDLSLIKFRADLFIDAEKGKLETIIKDLEEEYIQNLKEIGKEKTVQKVLPEFSSSKPEINFESLKYYNEYGGFSEDGKEYIIKLSKNNNLPTTWSHVLANENFGTVVTANGGGYTWSKNSRLNRLTAWSNNMVLDTPSEIIYLKDKEYGVKWSLGNVPMPDDNDYYIIFGLGYSKIYHSSYGIIQQQETYIPKDKNVKVNLLSFKNTTPEIRKLKLLYYIKPVLGEDEIKTNGFIDLKFDENNNTLSAKNLYGEGISNKFYVSSSEKILSYTGSKKEFGQIQNPIALEKVELSNSNSLGIDSCIAIELEIELKEYENKEISIIIGEEEEYRKIINEAKEFTEIEKCKQELENVKKYWRDTVRKLQVKTPLESMNIILNSWMVYQTIVSRLWARSGFYQSGGAYGFRDQLQDTLGMKYIDIDLMKKQIIKHASHQFIEGDVEHWWHEETKRGIRTKFSDDRLWLVYVVIEYLKFKTDEGILDEQIPYVEAEELKEEQDEWYDVHEQTEIKESLYDHCIRAINISLNFGENGLPKIGSGDWNDGFSTVGNKGFGESVWLGFFLYYILTEFISIAEKRNDIINVEKYKEILPKLKKALNTIGWDGRWFKRAFTDNGNILGSFQNEECKIDSIAQSWSVISNAGDNDKKYIAMESLDNNLVDKQNGIIKLLDPPFEKSNLEPGYIKDYLPGVRENGGQYTHGAIWAIIANVMLGFGDKALEYFRIINPIEHARTKTSAHKYKVEPYVIAADVYGSQNLAGRGGWTWYTGSSSWYYKAGIEYILGLKIENETLKIEPCIPKEWKNYSIRYEYGTSIYNILVENPNRRNVGVEKFIVNGQEIPEKQLKLMDNGKIYDIKVIMSN